MRLSELRPAKGAVASSKRIGRGQGSGKGGTSTRGHKGAKSRSGYSKKIGFEGGQMPLQRRVPKFGFKNRNRVEYAPINVERLQRFVDEKKLTDTITIADMVSVGLVNRKDLVKVLAKGEISAALKIEAHKFSKSAEQAITAAGGSVTIA